MTTLADMRPQHEAALDVLADLHLAGFTNCALHSQVYFSGGMLERKDGVTPAQVQLIALRVVLDDVELGPQQMDTISLIAAAHGATVSLATIRLTPFLEVSRIALWPKVAGE